MRYLKVRIAAGFAAVAVVSAPAAAPRAIESFALAPRAEPVKITKFRPKVAASAGAPLGVKSRRAPRARRAAMLLTAGGVPAIALRAYQISAQRLAQEDVGCRLTWPVLAAIGRVESAHGRIGRGRGYTPNGTLVPTLVGPALNGSGGTKVIRDTDDGRLDGDVYWDRAVGPMQFIPSTWRLYGADGNSDSTSDINNIFDSSLAAGRFLCSGYRDLGSAPQLAAALYAYNRSRSYVRLVLYVIAGYAHMDPHALVAAAGPLAVPRSGGNTDGRRAGAKTNRPNAGSRSGGGEKEGGGGSGSEGSKSGKPGQSHDTPEEVIPIPTILPTW